MKGLIILSLLFHISGARASDMEIADSASEKRFKGYEFDATQAASDSSQIAGEILNDRPDKLRHSRAPDSQKIRSLIFQVEEELVREN